MKKLLVSFSLNEHSAVRKQFFHQSLLKPITFFQIRNCKPAIMNCCQKYIDEYLRENPKYICEIFIINYNEHANSLKCCNI